MNAGNTAVHHAFTFHADFYSLGIPLLLLVVPWVVTRVLRTDESVQFPYWPNVGWLAGTAIAWYWSIQLPNAPISHETGSTTVHFVGGALVGPMLFAYFVQAYDIKRPPKVWMRYLMLFAAVGGVLGVSNEILEFALTKSGIAVIDISDTSWDIVENCVGLTVTFLVAEICSYWPARKPAPFQQSKLALERT